MSACSVCCTHRMCSVYCVWNIFVSVSLVLHVFCMYCVLYEGLVKGHVWHTWPFAWQTLVRWRKGYHSSIKDSGHTVPDGWLVSWRPTCVCFPAFSIRQREAALVWPTCSDLSYVITHVLALELGLSLTFLYFNFFTHHVIPPLSCWLCGICPHLAESGNFILYISRLCFKHKGAAWYVSYA